MWDSSAEARAARQLKKRQDRAASQFGLLIGIPIMFVYFTQYRIWLQDWLTEIGLLSRFGIMQFFQGPTVVDYDQVLVSAIVGALSMLPGYLLARPIARRLVR